MGGYHVIHPEKVMEKPEIYLIKAPLKYMGGVGVNCYVIKDAEQSLIIDTGMNTKLSTDAMRRVLKRLDIDAASATYFITHFHPDHVGGIGKLAGFDANVYCSSYDFENSKPGSAAALTDDLIDRLESEGVPKGERDMIRVKRVWVTEHDYSSFDLHPVSEGSKVNVGGISLDVCETSGHAQGHISLFYAESEAFFVGDLLLPFASPTIDLYPDGGDGFGDYLASLEKLKSLKVSRYFMSHGQSDTPFYSLIDRQLNHQKERKKQFSSLVSHYPDSTGHELTKKASWNVRYNRWRDIPPNIRYAVTLGGLAVLQHLVSENLIIRRRGDDGKYRYLPPSEKGVFEQ